MRKAESKSEKEARRSMGQVGREQSAILSAPPRAERDYPVASNLVATIDSTT